MLSETALHALVKAYTNKDYEFETNRTTVFNKRKFLLRKLISKVFNFQNSTNKQDVGFLDVN